MGNSPNLGTRHLALLHFLRFTFAHPSLSGSLPSTVDCTTHLGAIHRLAEDALGLLHCLWPAMVASDRILGNFVTSSARRRTPSGHLLLLRAAPTTVYTQYANFVPNRKSHALEKISKTPRGSCCNGGRPLEDHCQFQFPSDLALSWKKAFGHLPYGLSGKDVEPQICLGL